MEKNFKRTTVTSALPYANGPVHIGHLAGVYVPADIYVRYLRLKKEIIVANNIDNIYDEINALIREKKTDVKKVRPYMGDMTATDNYRVLLSG